MAEPLFLKSHGAFFLVEFVFFRGAFVDRLKLRRA